MYRELCCDISKSTQTEAFASDSRSVLTIAGACDREDVMGGERETMFGIYNKLEF